MSIKCIIEDWIDRIARYEESVSKLEAQLNRHDVLYVEAIAVKGVGVIETLTTLLQPLVPTIKEE